MPINGIRVAKEAEIEIKRILDGEMNDARKREEIGKILFKVKQASGVDKADELVIDLNLATLQIFPINNKG